MPHRIQSYDEAVEADAIRSSNKLYNWELMDYNPQTGGKCPSCIDLIDEYTSIILSDVNHQMLDNPKFSGIYTIFAGYFDIYARFEIYGCKHCLNKALLDFGSDLDLEDSERDHDYTRELKNQRMHHEHHRSRKNSKTSKKNKPISRNKKYRDVSVV